MRELSLNERRIIELIATRRTIARVDLAQASGLTGASVTRIIAALADLGLLEEQVDKGGLQGQPKRLLSLKPRSYYALGFTFSLHSLELAVIDITGHVVTTQTAHVPCGGATQVANTARAVITAVLKAARIPRSRIIGIGCAMPGNFSAVLSGQLIPHDVFSELNDKALLADFDEHFGLPFHMENDGTSAVLGEHIFGRQPDDGASPYLIHLGHGVGGGVIVDGSPFTGVNGNAGLLGFLFPYGKPRPSGLDLLETLKDRGHKISDFGDLETIAPHHPDLLAWCHRAGQQLRDAVRAASAILDPSVIILGGRLPLFVLEPLVKATLIEPIPEPSRGLTVAPLRASHLGPTGSAIGAACLPFFRHLFAGACTDFGSPYLNGRMNRPPP